MDFTLTCRRLALCLSDGTTDTLKQQRWFIGELALLLFTVFILLWAREFWLCRLAKVPLLLLFADFWLLVQKGVRSENWWNLIRNWVCDLVGLFCTLFKIFLLLFPPMLVEELTTIRGLALLIAWDFFLRDLRLFCRFRLKQLVQLIR